MSNPWDRQRDESGDLEPNLWFDRLTKFRLMGPGRSLLECVNRVRDEKGQKRSNIVPGSWRRASERWDWHARAEAWDEAERQRIEAEFKADCDTWRANRFRNANRLREKAEALLAFPVTKQTRAGEDEDGSKIYIIEPVSSSTLKDAASVLKAADELARITTRETLPKTETDLTSGGEKLTLKVIYDGTDDNTEEAAQ